MKLHEDRIIMAMKIIVYPLILYIFVISGCTTSEQLSVKQSLNTEAEKKFFVQNNIDISSSSSFPVLYFGGTEVMEGMLALIKKANYYIIIDTFLILNDRYGSTILNALKEKYKEGVSIYVLTDSSSRFLGEESGFEYLRKNNIPYAEYNAIRPWKILPPINLFKLRYRDHRKFWIVDGKSVLLGGSNIMESSLKSWDESGHTDGMVLIESENIAEQLLLSFIKTWNKYSSNDIHRDMFLYPDIVDRDTITVLINQNITDKEYVIEFMLNRLFYSATEKVWIIQPYTFINKEILDYLSEMINRGVTVNIVLSQYSNHPKYHYASFYGILDLLNIGANVWIYSYKNSPLHFKAFIIDNSFFSIGSANLNNRSLNLSGEANLVFSDKKSFTILKRSLIEIKKHLRKATYEEAIKYRGYRYRKWHLFMQNAG